MTKHLKSLVFIFTVVAVFTIARVQHAGCVRTHVGTQAQDKPAEQAYKNIQVFKGMPATQLLGVMNFMAGALGVSCNHCHVPNQFAKDDKEAKQVARSHILLTRTLNDSTFAGKPAINCVTCHHGQTRPNACLQLTSQDLDTPKTSAEPLPSVNQILERYAKALGGEAK